MPYRKIPPNEILAEGFIFTIIGPMNRCTILDVYNIVFSLENFRAQMHLGHIAVAECLFQWVAPLTSLENHRIIAVVDGGSIFLKSQNYLHGKNPYFTIIHTPSGQSADAEILRIIAKLQKKKPPCIAEVVSNDGGLCASANHEGATAISVKNFAQKMDYIMRQQRELQTRHHANTQAQWPNSIGDILGEYLSHNP
ncbi:MAG: NYN domain-containing protein [Puniceicoccales bacterium]|jgi:predicted RNA-binding protein with PIN domain|nr:NYN domain-containing protein [Puniceicoccales bacterium]